ncbi:MAG: hypothetical protein HKN16_07410 [Saprospiraceae bacterium]|nr:hypothetical protein [Saprospiraceae bacterium]
MKIDKYISEETIDQVIVSLEGEDAVENALLDIESNAPGVLAFLFGSDSELLSDVEKELLTFVSAALWKSAGESDTIDLDADEISVLEEKNWEKFENGGTFRDRLDVFYQSFPQEDLLSMVEDLLTEDGEAENQISREGRDHIFIKAKTFLDILIS